MAIDPEPRNHTHASTDFYALLNLPPTFSGADELRRAYRRGSRKYHPDKAVRPDASEAEKERAREQWDLFEVAVKLLEDASLRSQYDNARAAREQKKQRDAKFDAVRQAMVERLEKGERAAKRSAQDMMEGDEDEREEKRLAEMGRRAREALAAKRRAMEEEEEDSVREEEAVVQDMAPVWHERHELPVEERTIKVRFPAGADMDTNRLERLFSQFGAVDVVVLGKVKDERLGEDRKKRPLGRGYVQFKSKAGVYEAIHDWKDKRDTSDDPNKWQEIEDVSWMTKNPPAWADIRRESRSRSNTSTPKPMTPDLPSTFQRDTYKVPLKATYPGKKVAPSFSSFKSAKK